MGKDIRSFPLLQIDDAFDDASGVPREIFEESSIEPNLDDIRLADMLNKEQKAAYDDIMSTVDTEQGGLFFIDGPDGTGKTFFTEHCLEPSVGRTSLPLLQLLLVLQHL
jgi:hypothetical protein